MHIFSKCTAKFGGAKGFYFHLKQFDDFAFLSIHVLILKYKSLQQITALKALIELAILLLL